MWSCQDRSREPTSNLLGGFNDGPAPADNRATQRAHDAPRRDERARGEHDTVVGLAASGRTPYVVGALRRARERGASTVGISCNAGSLVGQVADVAIEVVTGPEVVTGSTRLKAGTAQKLVCNMLTTASMVQLGKVHENLMIDVRPTNEKLVDRARRIVATAAGVEAAVAAEALTASGNRPKVARVMLLAGASAGEAERRLSEADGSVRRAVG
ncbi:N-acetylmuramic acid 6-phosphate etherase [Calidifontibacter indicus]|nr:N-acetylmuramic acid 6-phosphate etherase [Calidifontibacter indicus]